MDFEIRKEGIVIIQWLREGDPQLGEELYANIRHKELERDNYFVQFYKTKTKEGFVDILKSLVDNTTEGTLFTLHIVAHGNMDRIGTEINTNDMLWSELFHYTRQLNIKMGNNLLLVLSSCVGGGILSYIEPEDRAPYRAIIANTREVFMEDAHRGFSAFYNDYFTILDFPKCLNNLNKSIDFSIEIEPGKKKTEFFIMSAETSFDSVFDPDRDPVFFKSIVDRIMPPNPLIPQEMRIEKAKELFRNRGKELKPYFTFRK